MLATAVVASDHRDSRAERQTVDSFPPHHAISVRARGSQVFTNAIRLLVAISPDGTQIVHVANGQLYVRSMSELEARPIPGVTQGVSSPVFSPDGRSVAFWSGPDSACLRELPSAEGAAVTICPANGPPIMSWGADGIVFMVGSKDIMRVSAQPGGNWNSLSARKKASRRTVPRHCRTARRSSWSRRGRAPTDGTKRRSSCNR